MNLHRMCVVLAVFTTLMGINRASAAVCTKADFTGVWGFQLGPTVGLLTADGNGNITNGFSTFVGGSTTTFAGTYTVARNCTGNITTLNSNGEHGSSTFVLYNADKAAQVIATDAGTGIAEGIALSQGSITCGLTGTRQSFAANLTGFSSTGQLVDGYVARVNLDGHGNITGLGTFAVNNGTTTYTKAAFKGTYTESSNCLGTAQWVVPKLGALNFSFVVVSGGNEILLIETDPGTAVIGNMQQ